MPKFQIFSDGSCDLTQEAVAENNIITIPFYVSLDTTNYQKELYELPINTFYEKVMNEHIYPKTSLPSVQDYIQAFTPALESQMDVLCFTITSSLSGSLGSAVAAKQILEETYSDRKILVVNSWLATGAQALLVLEAVRMQKFGLSIDEVYKKVENQKKTGQILFMVGGLDYLEHGGRIGKIASLSGKILNIKPLITLKNAEISVAGVSQSRKKALKKLSALTRNFFDAEKENVKDFVFKIGVTNTWDEVAPFEKLLKEELPQADFLSSFQIGATIAAHTGPDTIGVCFLKKFECI